MGDLLNREALLTKEELDVEQVTFDDGSFVFVRQMYGRERDRFEKSMLKEKKDHRGNLTYERSLEDFRAKLAVNTICDESGANLLKPGDVETLSQHMSAKKLEKIVNAARRLNGISEQDEEEMVKNSDGGQSEDSTSD